MSTFSLQDHAFMQRAIRLAKKGHYTTSPNPNVGCVLVLNNEIIGEGFHQKAGQGHAEVNAIADAKANGFDTQGATAYVTLEPCSHFGRTPPCAQGLIKAGVKQVIAAMVDPNPEVSGRGLAMLEQAGIKTQVGLLNADALALNPGFIKRMTKNLPYVRCKLAASLDGKTAMANGESKWITSSPARENVQQLRAQSCAIISGATSIITDNAKMSVRWQELGELKNSYAESDLRQPVRVIIDSQNRLTPDLALFQIPSPIILVRTAIENLPKWPHFVEQVVCKTVKNSQDQEKIDLPALIALLAERGLNDILVESGAQLAGAFIEQNLVDELILFQAPKLLGSDGKSLVAMPSIETLSSAKNLVVKDIRMVGPDIRITAKFKP
ncbi:bifunctional diaminohydroxyphosphoribosylaminopyrimidine deaminase/5-amino-6-(5-phosphoribosylamino)uracil reductase RibD [Thalassotalea sp. PLHSN55]|uniref:bifunctional diaminohydroxyphosphoribosylaminopyrimidine deaminase/5-amino-6-(5-phosphoribosylamino)uracil reductase RibD n=1 Tax=Thalassotalea sp. PLHSN55 TaxID=3435888 RepID=UPI003F86F243